VLLVCERYGEDAVAANAARREQPVGCLLTKGLRENAVALNAALSEQNGSSSSLTMGLRKNAICQTNFLEGIRGF
jgi:hypothetical protein